MFYIFFTECYSSDTRNILACFVVADENRSTYHSRISRRTALSKWLSEVLTSEVSKELDGCKAKVYE